jgi:tetratricopeptide (TPR) repeat protein
VGIAPRQRRALGLAAVLGGVALACLPKLGNAFVWDDLEMIVESDRLFDPRNLAHVFWNDTFFVVDGGSFQAQAQLDTYRPITIATFFLDAWLSGREPLGYHLDNLLAHLACVALVYFWTLRLLELEAPVQARDPHRLALAAAAFFGLHPILGEAHLWINGRSDLYCTLFGLSGALWWLAAKREGASPARLAIAGVLFLLGLLSKETLAPFLLVLLLWDAGLLERAVRALRPSRPQLLRALPPLAALATYTWLRNRALSGLHTSAGSEQIALALQRLPVLLLDGLGNAVLPRGVMPRYLHQEYGRLPTWTPYLCAAVVVAGAVQFARRRQRPIVALGVLGYAATLAPASLIATMAWHGFGRYLYLPLALLGPVLVLGAAGLLAGVAQQSERAARLCRLAGAAYLALFGVRLSASTADWDGPRAFYEGIIAESPDASHGHDGLGRYLLEHGEPARAILELERAVELAPLDSRCLNNLGVAYLRSGRLADASRVATLGLRRFPHQERKFAQLQALIDAAAR